MNQPNRLLEQDVRNWAYRLTVDGENRSTILIRIGLRYKSNLYSAWSHGWNTWFNPVPSDE